MESRPLESAAFESPSFSGQTPILVGVGEYRTDMFEESKYKIGDLLYCSCNGKITNETQYRGDITIGIVNAITKINHNYSSQETTAIGFLSCFASPFERPIPKKKETFNRYRILKNENK